MKFRKTKIEVEPSHVHGFLSKALINGMPAWGAGRTPAEAVGQLIMQHEEFFYITCLGAEAMASNPDSYPAKLASIAERK